MKIFRHKFNFLNTAMPGIFVLLCLILNSTSAQSISITEPNSSSEWQRGSRYEIRWSSTGGFDYVKIEFSINDGATWSTIIAQTTNDGFHLWTIPPTTTPSDYARVRVSDVFNASTSGTSGRFKITQPSTFTVLEPNGGEVWGTGITKRIRWSSSLGIANVGIQISTTGGATYNPIINSTPNIGYYDWNIPYNYANSTQCLIKVYDAASPGEYDVSNAYFTMTNVRSLTVVAPNGGELLVATSTYNIKWQSLGDIDTVNISVSTDNGASWASVVSDYPDLGNYPWKIPEYLAPASQALIRVGSNLWTQIYDTSDTTFSIILPTSFLMIKPNGGESLYRGETYGIEYIAPSSLGTIKLDITTDGGQTWHVIEESTANNGQYYWIPSTTLDLSCNSWLRVSDPSNVIFNDVSDEPFCILDRSLFLTVTSPNGGEKWLAGQTKPVTWDSSRNLGGLEISISHDNGNVFHVMDTNVPDTGLWNWPIPSNATTGGQNIIRIKSVALPGINDDSDDTFTLLPPSTDDAKLVSAGFPLAMAPGAQKLIAITMKNTGATSWSPSSGHSLVALDGINDPFSDGAKINLPDGSIVLPNDSYTFQVPLKAPVLPGLYSTYWTMNRDIAGNFGEVVSTDILVEDDSYQWLFAEGSTLDNLETYLLIVNPSDDDAATSLSLLPDYGDPLLLNFIMPARRRLTIKVDDFMDGRSMGFDLKSNNQVKLFAERAMYWGDGEWRGGHVSIGAAKPDTYWLLAEGATFPSIEEYVQISNPSESFAAELWVRLLRQNGQQPVEGPISVPPRSRTTLLINLYVPGESVSTEITSTNGVGVVAERAMYWNTDETRWIDGHASIGVNASSPTWYFAEGNTQGSFETYYLIANPTPNDVTVDVTFYYPDIEPMSAPVTVTANGRYTLLANLVRADTLLGAKFEASMGEGIVCERATYWDVGETKWGGGHATIGATKPSTKWFAPEGNALPDFNEYISVLNPNDANSEISITYFVENGTPIETQSTVPARRKQLYITKLIPSLLNQNFSAQVESTNGVPVVVERTMYWNSSTNNNELGHSSIAIPLD